MCISTSPIVQTIRNVNNYCDRRMPSPTASKVWRWFPDNSQRHDLADPCGFAQLNEQCLISQSNTCFKLEILEAVPGLRNH